MAALVANELLRLRCSGLRLSSSVAIARSSLPLTLARAATGLHGDYRGGGEDSVLQRALGTQFFSRLDIGESDGVAALTEGCIFVDGNSVGLVVKGAVYGDGGVLDTGDASG